MAFTTVVIVRIHAQLHDLDLAPDALIEQRIADAHADLLRDLDAAHLDSGDAVLRAAETELATAYVLRSLAGRAAAEERELRAGDFRLATAGRARALLERAADEERRGWARARPFLAHRPTRFGFADVPPTPRDPKRAP